MRLLRLQKDRLEMNDKISVIVPVYNAQQYLTRCVSSILNQTYKNVELILINDGSQDESFQICQKFQQKDSRVIVLNQTNSGVSCSRNRGLQKATGNWISFVDADDWIEETSFEWALEMQDKYNADIVMWNRLDDYPDKSKKCLYQDDSLLLSNSDEMEKFRLRIFTGYKSKGRKDNGSKNIYAKLIRKSLLDEHSIRFDEDLKHHEDMIFMMKAFEVAQRVYLENKLLYHRTMHGDSTIHKYYPDIVKDNALTSARYKEFLDSNKKSQVYYTFWAGMHVYWLMQVFSLYYFHKENEDNLRSKIKAIRNLLKNEPYIMAFQTIPQDIVLPKKIFIFLAQRRWIVALILYYRIYIRMRGSV